MNNHKKKASGSAPVMFEPLESRQFLSVSTAVKPDVSFSTSSALTVSKRSALIGQTVTIKAVVTSAGGTPRGTVELLENNRDTGLTGRLNHLGYYVFTFSPGQAAYVGTHLWRIRYLSSGSFVGSKSRQLIAKTLAPALTSATDGLQVATVATGTGVGAKTGQTVTVQYTGFNAANGSVFDDSANHSPGTFSFVLNANPENVISGFDQEVTGMKVGETRVAVLPSALGYKDNVTRVFVVHVVSIV